MSNISADEARILARSLYDARASLTPIAAFTDSNPALGLEDGYAIQTELVAMLLADGEQIGGYKLGLTSAPMQEMLGIDSPDLAPVLASTIYRDGDSLEVSRFIAPRVEAEIAIVLKEELRGPGVTVQDVRDAAQGAVAAIEIVDSRIRDWKIKLADTVADLASNGAIAIGSQIVPIDFDTRLIGMAFYRDGQLVSTGAGAAALGDPLAAVAWLANTLGALGATVPAGVPILTGALHAMVPITPGQTYVAEFDHLGSLTLKTT